MKIWIKNLLYRRWRVNRRPSNQLMMIWLKKALANNRHLKSAVDVGCEKSIIRFYFLNETYTGVDFKEEFISEARKLYPCDQFIVADITNELRASGDLIVCTLVFNNKHYPPEKTLEGISGLTEAVHKGGSLIFTTGNANVAYEQQVKEYLSRNFIPLDEKIYGNFNKPTYFSFPLAWLMFLFKTLRENSQNRMVFYICSGKI